MQPSQKTPLRAKLMTLFGVIVAVAFFAGFLGSSPVKAQVPTIGVLWDGSVHGWAWSDDIGWIQFNCDESSFGVNSCATWPQATSVHIDTVSGLITGFAWNDGIGWISFNSDATNNCPTGSCQATVQMTTGLPDTGKVTGWARACSVFSNNYNANPGATCSGTELPIQGVSLGGWDGWIHLSDPSNHPSPYFDGSRGVSFNPFTGKFCGFAWGGQPVGWVEFGDTCGITGQLSLFASPTIFTTATGGTSNFGYTYSGSAPIVPGSCIGTTVDHNGATLTSTNWTGATGLPDAIPNQTVSVNGVVIPDYPTINIVSPNNQAIYRITCQDQNGTPIVSNNVIIVRSVQSGVGLSGPSCVVAGNTLNIHYTVTNVSQCTTATATRTYEVSGGNGTVTNTDDITGATWSGSNSLSSINSAVSNSQNHGTSGVITIPNAVGGSTYTFTLSCTNLDGTTSSDTQTINTQNQCVGSPTFEEF